MGDDGELKRFASELALESGELIRSYAARGNVTVTLKSDRTVVTEADRNAEQLMRDRIMATYPEHGIVGEEHGAHQRDAEHVWYLDPIDGTLSFIAGVPLYGTLIALTRRGRPVLGVIHQPITGELCLGDGEETTVNGQPVRVRDTASLGEAVVLTTDITSIARFRQLDAFERLRTRAGLFRTWGDCYGYLVLARGGAQVMIDPIMNAWDMMPLIPIVEGAGGVITSWSGGDPLVDRSVVAAVPSLHGTVVGLLSGSSL